MKRATSAPTERVVDILEFVAGRTGQAVRFSDVALELELTQGTTNAILNSLCDRGWLTRDPRNKAYSLGPSLAAVATASESALPLTHAATRAAVVLSGRVGYPASVVQRTGDSLTIVAFEGGAPGAVSWLPGARIPYAPPFGIALAAWASVDEQRAWLARSPNATGAVVKRLRAVLDRTRERGFDVDRTTPAVARMAQFVGAARSDGGVSDRMVAVLEKALVECTKLGLSPLADSATAELPVATIAAPLFNGGEATLLLGVHPGRPLSAAETDHLGAMVVAATQRLRR